MHIRLSEQARKMIDRPNFAHLATLMSDGSPHVAPVWINRDGDRVIISTSSESVKGKIRTAMRGSRFRSWISRIRMKNFSYAGA